MNRILSAELPHHIGEIVHVSGWLHRLRRLRNVTFLILRDRSGLAQVVVEDESLAASLSHYTAESVLMIEGRVKAVEQAPNGVEIHQPQVKILSPAIEPPTFDLFRPALNAQLPTILDHAVVALRHPVQKARWHIAAMAMAGFRASLAAENFVEIQTPKIVATATESGANVFQLDYFGMPAYLAQSPQFYKQIMVAVFERVFEVAPVFRAEPHATTRHLAQYTSLDLEMGFIENHFTVMQMLTRVLRGMMCTIEEKAAASLKLLELTLPQVPNEIPHLHFKEAQERYFEATGDDQRAEPDLSPVQERWLGEWAWREYQSDFVFVTGYPMVKRPFYTHADPDQPEYSRSFDLLFRGLELVTGGQRLHQYADYLAALEIRSLSPEPLETYLAAFKHGMPPHGGCAIGLERFVAQLTGVANIREVTLFPRDMTRISP
jgi:nondiscriminating aspartyl-tRNA synthetase